jgi:hypothetical protein
LISGTPAASENFAHSAAAHARAAAIRALRLGRFTEHLRRFVRVTVNACFARVHYFVLAATRAKVDIVHPSIRIDLGYG